MRKTVIALGLILIFFIVFFLQANIFSSFTIAGITPNLFVIYVLFIGLFANQFFGISLGVLLFLKTFSILICSISTRYAL